jgi:hypothetical protein
MSSSVTKATGTETPRAPARGFLTTHWSVVLSAGRTYTSHSQAALEKLCRAYWYLGIEERAVKVAVHRLRQRYRELLRAEIANMVGSPEEVDAEMHHLFNVLARRVLPA